MDRRDKGPIEVPEKLPKVIPAPQRRKKTGFSAGGYSSPSIGEWVAICIAGGLALIVLAYLLN